MGGGGGTNPTTYSNYLAVVTAPADRATPVAAIRAMFTGAVFQAGVSFDGRRVVLPTFTETSIIAAALDPDFSFSRIIFDPDSSAQEITGFLPQQAGAITVDGDALPWYMQENANTWLFPVTSGFTIAFTE